MRKYKKITFLFSILTTFISMSVVFTSCSTNEVNNTTSTTPPSSTSPDANPPSALPGVKPDANSPSTLPGVKPDANLPVDEAILGRLSFTPPSNNNVTLHLSIIRGKDRLNWTPNTDNFTITSKTFKIFDHANVPYLYNCDLVLDTSIRKDKSSTRNLEMPKLFSSTGALVETKKILDFKEYGKKEIDIGRDVTYKNVFIKKIGKLGSVNKYSFQSDVLINTITLKDINTNKITTRSNVELGSLSYSFTL